MSSLRNVAVLGSTGSIGRATLDVLERLRKTHRVAAISCHSQLELFEEQIHATSPRDAIVTDASNHAALQWQSSISSATKRWLGSERIASLVTQPDIDIVVSAIVGVAGLESAIGAVKSGKRLALANKESLVVAG